MERKYSKFKVAAVQAAPVYLDLEYFLFILTPPNVYNWIL